MKDIDNYIDSLYNNSEYNSSEIDEMKADMRLHLIETVEELKREGRSEKESIRIAINRFGDVPDLKSELSDVIPLRKKHYSIALYVSLATIASLFAFIILTMNINGNNSSLKGVILIFAIPIYVIIRATRLEDKKKNNEEINLKSEMITLVFVIYLVYLVGTYVTAFYTYPNYSQRLTYFINVIPLINIPNKINDMAHRGLPLYIFLRGMAKFFIRYLPIGILGPIISEKFRKLHKCVLLGVSIYLGISLINSILCINGLAVVRVIDINVDYLIVSVLGVMAGYLIYHKKLKYL